MTWSRDFTHLQNVTLPCLCFQLSFGTQTETETEKQNGAGETETKTETEAEKRNGDGETETETETKTETEKRRTSEPRLSLPFRIRKTRTCEEIADQIDRRTSIHQSNILDTLNNNRDIILNGQAALLAEILSQLESITNRLDNSGGQFGGAPDGSCPPGASFDDGKVYTVYCVKKNYADATAACAATGGTLATMTAENEAFLYGLAGRTPTRRAWIGLMMVAGNWEWQDGSLYGGFTDWQGAEPSRPAKQCVDARAFKTPQTWKDRRCTDTTFYICQTDDT